MTDKNLIASVEQIESQIFLIRGQKVMLDEDLAALYGVETKRLNEQVRRNSERFPEDFLFQLTSEEFADLKSQLGISSLRSQIATSNNPAGRGGRRSLPTLLQSRACPYGCYITKELILAYYERRGGRRFHYSV